MTPGPSAWVERFGPLVQAGGAVLDVAAGGGRHGRWFLQRGHTVTLVDRDVSALADLDREPRAAVLRVDLEDGAPAPLRAALGGRAFDAVVVVNYLWRPLFADLEACVAPGGLLIFDTFAQGNEVFGRPRRSDFLLRENELLQAFPALRVTAFEQGRVATPSGDAVRQRLCAVRARGGLDTTPLAAPLGGPAPPG